MPCYLFTYHAHGSWMPDRRQGYVRRKAGILATDSNMATCYRRNTKQDAVVFHSNTQRLQIEAVLEACPHIAVHCHGIATDASHVHLLVSWKSKRSWKSISEAIKTRLTRDLNSRLRWKRWFSKGRSRKRVKDRRHFGYLMESYLPKHRGLKWREDLGIYR